MTRRMVVVMAVALLAAPLAGGATLYNPALGTLPQAQGWMYLTDPLFGASATAQLLPHAARLDTLSAIGESAGWFGTFHPGIGTLDRAAGFALDFALRIDAETHTSDNRAGFSLIALSDDLFGIELGFWEDSVWAQSGPEFIRAETAGFDTTAASVEYRLAVLGATYSLTADGAPLLSGPLRDYSPHPHPVYSQSNFLFFGDNTSSAAARAELGTAAVTVIPEPVTLALLSLAMLGVLRRRSRN